VRCPANAYVLLETVIATALLITALTVIGGQVRHSREAVEGMKLRARAVMLAELHLAELDLGLIELDSIDQIQEGDFGPRFPDWGWRLITERTGVEQMFQLQVDVLHHPREGGYRPDDFDFDQSRKVFTAHAFRAAPAKLNFAADFGLNDEELTSLSTTLGELGGAIPDLSNFPANALADPSQSIEDMLPLLAAMLTAMGQSVEELAGILPPEIVEQLQALSEGKTETDDGSGSGGGSP